MYGSSCTKARALPDGTPSAVSRFWVETWAPAVDEALFNRENVWDRIWLWLKIW